MASAAGRTATAERRLEQTETAIDADLTHAFARATAIIRRTATARELVRARAQATARARQRATATARQAAERPYEMRVSGLVYDTWKAHAALSRAVLDIGGTRRSAADRDLHVAQVTLARVRRTLSPLKPPTDRASLLHDRLLASLTRYDLASRSVSAALLDAVRGAGVAALDEMTAADRDVAKGSAALQRAQTCASGGTC
jgi:hypothetical protein